MVSRQKKEQSVSDLTERFKKANSFYIIDFLNLNSEETLRWRRELKKSKLEYIVAKNTLIKIALANSSGITLPEAVLKGQSGIVFSYEDAIAPAKIVRDNFEKFGKPALKAAILEGQFFDGSRLKEIAALPGKKEIIASILGSLDSPVSGIIGSINAILRDVASIIEEVAKQRAA